MLWIILISLLALTALGALRPREDETPYLLRRRRRRLQQQAERERAPADD